MYESTKKAIQKYREKNKSITLLISKTFYERIKKQSEKDNTSVSSLIKTAVAEYLDKRAAEMAQAKAQAAAERAQRKQEKEQAREAKEQAEREAFKAAHAYDPEKDLPKPEKPVVVPEPLEPIDYHKRMEEQRQKEEEEKRKREAEEEAKQQAEAFERMKQAQQALAQEEAQERAQEVSRRSRPLPAQPTDNRKPRTVDVKAEAVRPVDKPAEELDPIELMKRYDRFGTLRLTFIGPHKQERYLEALRKMHEEATQNG